MSGLGREIAVAKAEVLAKGQVAASIANVDVEEDLEDHGVA